MLKSLFKEFEPNGIIKSDSKRLRYIDVAYFIGVILVILGHSHPLDLSWNFSWYWYMNNFIYTFHMQLYFFIAGYLLVHSSSIDRLGFKKWAGGKLLKFGIPYLILTVIAYFPKAFIGNTSDSVELSLGYFFRTTFLEPRAGVWGHFWFIAAFLTLDLIWGLWRAYAPKSKAVYYGGLFVGCLVSLYIAIFPIKTNIFTLKDLSEVSIFYAAGILVALFKPTLWNSTGKNIAAIIICAVGAYFLFPYGNYASVQIPIVFEAVGFLIVWLIWNLAQLLSKINRFTLPEKLSKYTFIIYIYSWPAQAATESLIRFAEGKFSYDVGLVTTVIILFSVGWLVPFAILFIYKKLEFLHCSFFDYLIGYSTKSIKGGRQN